MTGIEPIATVIACALLCIFLCIFYLFALNPDSVRSQYTEETLSVASAMLEDIKGGLTQESARLVCPAHFARDARHDGGHHRRGQRACLRGRVLRKNYCQILPSTRLPHATLSNMASCSRSTVWWMSWARTARTTKSPPALSPPSRWAIVPSARSSSTTRPRAPSTVPSTRLPRACRDFVHAARHPRARGAKELTRAPRCVRCRRRLTRTSCSTR